MGILTQYGFIWIGLLILALVALGWVIFGRTKEITQLPFTEKFRFVQPQEKTLARVCRNLSDAIAIPTETLGGDFDAMSALLEERYPRLHARMERQQIGSCLLYRWASGSFGDPVLFCSHMDTVPVGANEDWVNSPLGGREESGYIWGRGALDSKCTMICLMEALEQLIEQGYLPRRDIYLALSQDEEAQGHQGAAAVADYLRKKGVRLELVLDEGDFILKNFLGQNRVAVAVVNVAEKGVMDLELLSRDKGGHAAYPARHTGLGRLCEAVARVESAPLPRQFIPLTEDYFDAIAPLMSCRYRVMMANRWLFRRPLLRLLSKNAYFRSLVTHTTAATMAQGAEETNMLPQLSRAVLDIRPLPGTNAAEVHNHILNLVQPLGVETRVLSQSEPSESDCRQSEVYETLCQCIHQRFGEAVIVAPSLTARTSDAKCYERICKNVMRFTPLVIKEELKNTLHGADERAPMAALGAAAEFYREFIRAVTEKEPPQPTIPEDED